MTSPAMKKSPLAPKKFPALPPIAGLTLATARAGLRKAGDRRDDLMLAAFTAGSCAAGVLTRSATAAAPVLWCRKVLPAGRARALVVNAGNANAFTGAAGERAVAATAGAAGAAAGCAPGEVLVASTGVIGEPLPVDDITAAIAGLTVTVPGVAATARTADFHAAAQAITTTDTFAKGAAATATVAGTKVSVAGIAKGSGMVAPDMATMLAFVFTDAAIAPAALRACLRAAVEQSFHCITVDGDTSTSDTVVLVATAAAGNRKVTGAAALGDFRRALTEVCTDLAVQVVRDGEGAAKLIRVEVSGARNDASARRAALAVANSPLVKTAIAGGDANWGRVVMALGKSGEALVAGRMRIQIGGVTVAERGARAATYDRRAEAAVTRHLAGREVTLSAHLGAGRGRARVWTCDLTHGYIRINADYRT